MKVMFQKWAIALLLVFLLVFSAQAEGVILINEDLEPKTREETLAMLSALGYSRSELRKDLYGNDRMVRGRL